MEIQHFSSLGVRSSGEEVSAIQTLQFENLSKHTALKHFVSTRVGGVSPLPFHSLNIGLHVNDATANVLQNRTSLASHLAIPPTDFVFAKQVHGSKVTIVTPEMKGRGALDHADALDGTDAMVTDVEDLCLTVLVADCVPILFLDPRRRVVGAAHAGWKGTVGGIAGNVVTTMVSEYGCDREKILVGIGPSIGPCCYEVGSDVASRFRAAFGEEHGKILSPSQTEDLHLDLKEANRLVLEAEGILPANIESSDICTSCSSSDFFSYRREGATGRFCAGIMLVNEICASCTAIQCTWCNK